MKTKKLNIIGVYTRPHDVCYGVIEVYPQEAEGKDLTHESSLEKHVPVIRALCYNSPNMYKTLRDIIRMAKNGSSAKEICGYAKEAAEAVEKSYSAYKHNVNED